MQYRFGTVEATNASATITGDITEWLSEISAGDLFTVVGSGVTYEVASVVSDTELTLSVPYQQATESSLEYVIARSFTPVLHLPYPEAGDVETSTIYRKAFAIIDGLVELDSSIEDPEQHDVLTYDGDKWVNAPIRDIAATEYDAGSSGASKTLVWANGMNQVVTMTDTCTFTLSMPTSGVTYKIRLVQGGSGSYTVAWPGAVKWAGGAAPTLSTSVAAIDIVSLYFNGTNYYGMAGIGFA